MSKYWLRNGVDADGLFGIRVYFKKGFFSKTLMSNNLFWDIESAQRFIRSHIQRFCND